MEFVHREGPKSEDPKAAENFSIRVNWFYRPKDISRRAGDSRMLYATMHSDICPLHSVRGKCTVTLRDYIEDFYQYRATPNCFWFDKLYDRYIVRFYDVIPTEKIINIPPKLHQILCEKFKYALVEVGKGKELLAAAKSCEKCSQWCSPEDSVQCAHCKHHYHMLCVDPPLYRKPSRGFGWSCAVCSLALERKLEENKGLFRDEFNTNQNITADSNTENTNEDDNDNATTEAPSVSASPQPPKAQNGSSTERPASASPVPMSRYEELEVALSHSLKAKKAISEEQRHQLRMWPFRYLGVHSKLEDILDGDDRIYPRAQSRLGSKHQAVVPDWPGRPVVYYEVEKVDRKSTKRSVKNRSASSRLESKEGSVNAEVVDSPPMTESVKERPPWMQQRPTGYIERGSDETATLMWKQPPAKDSEIVTEFLKKTEPYAAKLHITHHTPNFVDACLQALLDADYNLDEALARVAKFNRRSLKEPTFTADQKILFEGAVRKYGSELHDVHKVVGKTAADIVRYYYLWKKTPAGHEIWDNFEGRKSKKGKPELHSSADGLVDEVANAVDDSAYDNEKSQSLKRTYQCKFCLTTDSRQWRRAPGFPVAETTNPITALCIRCARLWRRYAVIWENPEEVLSKLTSKNKRRIEEELLEDCRAILAEREKEREREGARKKLKADKYPRPAITSGAKTAFGATTPPTLTPAATVITTKDKKQSSSKKQSTTEVVERVAPLCSVCLGSDDELLICHSCGLHIHSHCYGVISPSSDTWLCDTCSNDQNPLVSTLYSCSICPIRDSHDLNSADRSVNSDALKRTSDNNWAHVRCAIWMPEIRFGSAQYLQPVEEIHSIPQERFREVCTICGTINGACISCAVCSDLFHVGCAGRSNYVFGFDVQPVKSTRRDHFKTVKIGKESGILNAVVMCPHHHKQIRGLHGTNELVEERLNKTVLQLYCETYKVSAHLDTGSMRRALLYPLKRASENRDRKSEIRQAADSLALVLSQLSDHVKHPIVKTDVSCSQCGGKCSPFWFEDKLGEELSVKCLNCHWVAEDKDVYDEAYYWDPVSIMDPAQSQRLKEKTEACLQAISFSASQLQIVQDAKARGQLMLDHGKDNPAEKQETSKIENGTEMGGLQKVEIHEIADTEITQPVDVNCSKDVSTECAAKDVLMKDVSAEDASTQGASPNGPYGGSTEDASAKDSSTNGAK